MRARPARNRCNTGHPRAWSIARFPIRTPSRAREPLSRPTRRTFRASSTSASPSPVRGSFAKPSRRSRGARDRADQRAVLRWRGHRYLSVREFDRAFADLTRGGAIDSTIYGIWYHLGVVQSCAETLPRRPPRSPRLSRSPRTPANWRGPRTGCGCRSAAPVAARTAKAMLEIGGRIRSR